MEDVTNKGDEKKKYVWFGRDVSKIPCFRNTWLYGISCGIGAGILTFMFTSRPSLSCHMFMGTMSVVTLTYFPVCRYKFAKEEIMALEIKGLMSEAFVAPGPEQSDALKKLSELVEA